MKLTFEQQAAADRIVNDRVQIGLSIQPINRDAATEAVLSLYDVLRTTKPEIVLHTQQRPVASTISGLLLLEILGQAGWLTRPTINRRAMNKPKLFRAIKHLVSQADHVSMTPSGNGVAISDRPSEIHLDARQRPHRLDGPALLYRDGWAIYAIHGVAVPREVVEQPSSITVERIDKEQNIEVRRVMIERYGLDRYMKDSQAELLHRDATGLLYRKQVTDDEAIVMVRVLNSTPEPDGTLSRDEALVTFGEAARAALRAPADARFKEYMIRVPPNMTKTHEAVAWTFGLTAEDYHPALET